MTNRTEITAHLIATTGIVATIDDVPAVGAEIRVTVGERVIVFEVVGRKRVAAVMGRPGGYTARLRLVDGTAKHERLWLSELAHRVAALGSERCRVEVRGS